VVRRPGPGLRSAGLPDGALPCPAGWPGRTWRFLGPEAVAVVEAGGKRLRIAVSPDAPELSAALAPLVHLVGRRGTARHVAVTVINDALAGESPYLPALKERFEVVRERKGVVLYPARG